MDNTIGARIKAVRGEMLQTHFSEMLGVHKNSLSRYERGVGLPDAQFIQSLCTTFEIEANWLLFGEGPRKRGAAAQPRPNKEGQCVRCEVLEAELSKERDLSRELMQDNRELMKENRKLMRENSDLRVELAEIKARAAPDGDNKDEERLRVG
ncbi:helix-turn-helix domain-containing protein [Maridesulfovibrio bastinii]|uniref:helix-turn-helix domain-containing protein n=1 Tax=Maridesulfovibrio bastinii TaxID=47157 RepID=UPI0006887EA9|nr:helix-turn-helix transcriptional regulator [Maridesulfovibrio bastinii]